MSRRQRKGLNLSGKQRRNLEQTVAENQAAVQVARVMPSRRKGKKCPPMATVPPGPTSSKRTRWLWYLATLEAAAIAEGEG